MQPLIFQGASISTPNNIGGVVEPDSNATLAYGPSSGFTAGSGNVGRYRNVFDWFGQARTFWQGLDQYAQQHTVDAYRFELGNVANTSVAQSYIDQTLNQIDNCLARRVAYGIGLQLPSAANVPAANGSGTAMYPSLYPLAMGMEPNKSNIGLNVAVIANDTLLTEGDYNAMMSQLSAQGVMLTVVAPRMGVLQSGVNATASYITASSVFYDAVFIGSTSADGNSSSMSNALKLDDTATSFVMQAYSHGKAIGALGNSGAGVLAGMGLSMNQTLGVYSGDAGSVTNSILTALSGPVRFPQRFPTDDLQTICGGGMRMRNRVIR